MKPTSSSPCILTDKVVESRDYYTRYFSAKVVFDCGWYVSVDFGNNVTLQFMTPRDGQRNCNTDGLTYNFRVVDVDLEYGIIVKNGIVPIMPLEDHPWGDRGFAIKDPNGVTVYIYSDREPSDEFKKSIKG